MTLAEYVSKFESLARFSTTLMSQPNDEWKSKRFEQGLRPELRKLVTGHRIVNFQQLLDVCQLTENSIASELAEKQANWKRKREGEGSKGNKDKGGDSKGKKVARQNEKTAPKCATCGRNHYGKCWGKKGVICFRCHKPGHMKDQCPENEKDKAKDALAPMRG